MAVLALACIALLSLRVDDAGARCEGYPCIEYIPPQVIPEDEEWTFDLSAYVSFNTSHPDLTFSDDCPYVHVNAETGLLTWTPTNDDVGEHLITITVGDDTGRYDTQRIKVTVEGEHSGPRISVRSSFVLVQDVPFHHVVGVEDVHEGEREHMMLMNDHRELFEVDNRTGVIDLTPRNEHVGTWTVTLELWAYGYIQDTAVVTFQVVNRNDRPTLERMHRRLVREGEPVDISLACNEPDLEPRLLDNSTPVDPEEALAFDTTLPHPTSFETSGMMVWTPTGEDARRGNVTAYFKVADQHGLGDSFCVTFVVLHVHKVYNVQIIGIVEGQKVSEGQRVMLRASAASTDPPDELTYRWYAGTTLIGQTQDITWKVRGRGHVSVRLVVEDRYGTEAELTVNITVRSISSPPDRSFIYTCLSTIVVVIILVVYKTAMWIGADRVGKLPRYGPRVR